MAKINFDANLIEQNSSGVPTMVGFDIDQMKTDTHLLLEQYHIFSKTPAAPGTTLGGARNKAGHTTTSSDIWSQEIPAFFKAYSNDDLTRFASLAKKNDLVLLAYKKSDTEPNGAVLKFVDGAWTKIHDSIASIPDGTEFYNSVDTKPVIRFHQNSAAVILSGDNNNTDGSNGFSAKICAWDKSTNTPFPASAMKFVPQFVSPMDKMVSGIPSSGYDAIVKVGTTEDDILAESTTSAAGYIANSYAGIIHFNTARSDKQIYVHAFEYIGNKLDTTLTDIDEKISKVVGDAFEGAVASVTADSDTENLGLTVSEGANPVITVTPGTISDAKLVTGSTVKTYIDTTALAEGGSIAEYVEDYVATNAKVSVNGQSATTITVAGTEESSSDIVHIKVTEDKTTTDKIGLTLTATIDAAVLNEDGSIKEDGVVIATIAEKIADSAIKEAIETDNGAIKDAIDTAISGATLNSGTQGDNQIQTATGDTANKLVTAAQVKEYVDENAKVTLTANTTAGNTGIIINPNATESTSFTIGVDQSVIATKKSVDDLSSLVTGVSQTVADIQTDLATGATAQAIAKAQGAADDAMEEAQKKVASVSGPTTGLVTVSGDTAVTITVSDEIATKTDAANAASSAITTSLNGTTTGTIGKAIADVKTTADAAVKTVSKSGSSTLLTVTQTGTAVTVGLSDTVATKSDITTEINKLTAADGAITALDGRVDAIETSLADGGTIHELIDAAKAAADAAQDAADAKVADVTVNGASIVTGDAGSKTVALTTTKTDAITASADSTSTALATEASVAKALASITSVGVSYEVIPDGQTHTSITAPVKGRIYLEKDATNAEAGVYIEWFYTGSDWEKIGSTKTDHSTYASTITVNGSPKTVANSTVDLGAFASSVVAGNGIASGSVSATGALSLTLTTGSTTTVGIVQLTDTYTSTDATKAATGKSIAAAIATLDASKSVNGITVTQVDGKITDLTETLITASVPESTTKVEGNIAYVGSTKHVIAPEKFQTAAQMPATLTSWVADLSNLTNGDNMFKGCTGLTTFVGDLSSLTSGVDMFNGCALDDESLEILAENLPTVTSGTIDIGGLGVGANHIKIYETIRQKVGLYFVMAKHMTPQEVAAALIKN